MSEMHHLSRDTVLQRASNMRLQIDSSNNTRVMLNGEPIDAGPHALAVLDVFYEPLTIGDALQKLQPRLGGAQDWMSLTATLQQFHEVGVLLDQTGKRPSFSQDDRGYARPGIHVAMLNDRSRTSSFLAGISEVVRPGDVVLDIGTGSGVLAVAAAQAGARHVYAVEASGISRLAQAIFEVNGLDNCVTLLQGWSTSLTLPERADVMVSEMVGNEPLAENLLEMTLDARKRLLKPQARMVPARVKVFGLPLAIPRAGLEKSAVTRAGLRKWLSWYGIDFRPFADAARSSPTSFHVKPQAVRRWKTCGEPVLLADIDFGTTEQLVVDTSRTVLATAAGRLNGLPVYFELGLGPTTCFSTAPAQASPHNHWYSQVWVTPEPLDLKIGDAFTVSYRHRAPGPRVAVTSA